MEDNEGDDDVNPLLVNAGEETDQATKTKLWFGKVSKDKISYNFLYTNFIFIIILFS